MGTTRYASVLGLGFGDCGKGRFVDLLTRRWQAHTVVRFNGGAQAGHNVVTSATPGSPGIHHTFSQFGSGTLVPGTHTILVDPMIVNPTALLVEACALGSIGVDDALPRLQIDARCRVTTPFHQAAGRLRERLRGAAAHGTCGVGVGETVRHSHLHPEQVIHYRDCAPSTAAARQTLTDKLQVIRKTLLADLQDLSGLPDSIPDNDHDVLMLRNETLAARWIPAVRALGRQCPPSSPDELATRLTLPGCVLFEGAQGVLLDEWRGFHPHTTWSSIGTSAVEDVARRLQVEAPFTHLGVLRSYPTRHGLGPFPTHDPELDVLLPEPHNDSGGWQGAFRRGHPDAVLMRYALDVAGPLSGLLMSHLDVFNRRVPLKWCHGHKVSSPSGARSFLNRIPLGPHGDLEHQAGLTRLLESAEPQYENDVIRTPTELVERIQHLSSLPVVLRSYGPATENVA